MLGTNAPSPRAQQIVRFETKIHAAHRHARQTYGPKHLQADWVDAASKLAALSITKAVVPTSRATNESPRLLIRL